LFNYAFEWLLSTSRECDHCCWPIRVATYERLSLYLSLLLSKYLSIFRCECVCVCVASWPIKKSSYFHCQTFWCCCFCL